LYIQRREAELRRNAFTNFPSANPCEGFLQKNPHRLSMEGLNFAAGPGFGTSTVVRVAK